MADQLTQELLERIRADFKRRCENHPNIQAVERNVLAGKADFRDVNLYAGSLGSTLANSLIECIDFTQLPDGRLYYDLAREILSDTLKNNYELINAAAARVQKDIDAKLGLKQIGRAHV